MNKRSEKLIALTLPAIAISWVVSDTALNMVSADRTADAPMIALEDIAAHKRLVAARPAVAPAPHANCRAENVSTARGIEGTSQRVMSVTMQRLCEAGLTITASLPKT